MKETITVETTVDENSEKVWMVWNSPEHITHWHVATPDWHCPSAEHDLRVGGLLKYHMAARDGSIAFDYIGSIEQIKPREFLSYVLEDGRRVIVRFKEEDGATKIVETFEADNPATRDLEQQGWQAILDNFKKYTESL